MGDLMHALPAITEAKKEIPDIKFDWVVDTNFSSVPSWHPAINKVIETNHREWKLNLFSSRSRKAIKNVINTVNGTDYDFIIDMQNNLKSAFISFLCKDSVTGMDSRSSREYPAHLAYSKKAYIPKDMHAIERQKMLLAFALGYKTNHSLVEYGISKQKFVEPIGHFPEQFVVCVQNASWKTKQWPIENWKDIVRALSEHGLTMLFPSGNKHELERAIEICSVSKKAIALEVMSLNEIAFLVDNAKFSLCSDTGLAHLSAVTSTPSLTFYGPTATNLIGTRGENQNHLVANDGDLKNLDTEVVLNKLKELNFI